MSGDMLRPPWSRAAEPHMDEVVEEWEQQVLAAARQVAERHRALYLARHDGLAIAYRLALGRDLSTATVELERLARAKPDDTP